MEYQEQWLLCQNGRQGRKRLYFTQDAQAYYLLEDVTNQKQEKLRGESISEELLHSLNIRYERIEKSKIRAISIGGYGAGDAFYLYPESGKRKKYLLKSAYSKAELDVFFAGMKRFEAPTDKKQKRWDSDSWRKENRDQEVYEKCKYVAWGLAGLSAVCAIGYGKMQNGLWLCACLLCLLVSVILTICYPSYFTLMLPRKKEKSDAWELGWSVIIELFAFMCMPALNWVNFNQVMWVGAGVGILAALVLALTSEEYRKKPEQLLIVLLIAGVLGYQLVGQFNRVFDSSAAYRYELTVENLHTQKPRKGARSYYCEVTLPDGREAQMKISRSLYESLEEGAYIQVVYREGAFGIEYLNAKGIDKPFAE